MKNLVIQAFIGTATELGVTAEIVTSPQTARQDHGGLHVEVKACRPIDSVTSKTVTVLDDDGTLPYFCNNYVMR